MLNLLSLVLAYLFFMQPTLAEVCNSPCKSELIRARIDSSVINTSTNQWILNPLKKLAQSPMIENLLNSSHEIEPFGMPHDRELCLTEQKRGNKAFEDVDCNSSGLCANRELNLEARDAMCFKIPCAIIEGPIHAGKCKSVSNIAFTSVGIQNLDLKMKIDPIKASLENGKANLCFKVKDLEVNMALDIDMDIRKTELPEDRISINNINPKWKSPRDICITAEINPIGPKLVKNIKIVPSDNKGPIISDQLIQDVSERIEVTGLTGHPDLPKFTREVAPVLFHPMRNSIERAMTESISGVFEKQINKLVKETNNGTILIDSSSYMKEISLPNYQYKQKLSVSECFLIVESGKKIPQGHPCIGQKYYNVVLDQNTTCQQVRCGSTPNLKMNHGANVDSPELIEELLKLRSMLEKRLESPFFANMSERDLWSQKSFTDFAIRDIDDALKKISDAVNKDQISSFIEIQTLLEQGTSNGLGLLMPDLCLQTPSPHANRKMKNCQVEVYADLNEFNRVLDKMWNTGRMCESGRGEYIPETETKDGKVTPLYNRNGWPLVKSGCNIRVGPMNCYISKPPRISFQKGSKKRKKYKMDLGLKGCFFPGVMFTSIASFGGDFDADFAFEPKPCFNGDICLENPDMNINLVPGTGRLALEQGKTGMIPNAIRGAIKDAGKEFTKEGVRLPIASQLGPLAEIPIEADSRPLDMGDGFIGACFKVQQKVKSE